MSKFFLLRGVRHGVATTLGKALGKWIGEHLRVSTEEINGVRHFVTYVYTYEKKLEDLPHEKVGVSRDYLKELIEEAHRKHDFNGLKVIHDYLKSNVNDLGDDTTQRLLNAVIKYGKEIKLFESVGDPFAFLDKMGDIFLC